MRLTIFAALAVALLAVFAAGPAHAQEERRLALVIGIGNYDFGPLANPVNDAGLVTAALKRIGFKVTPLENPTKGQFRQAIDRLYEEARSGTKNATVFVYFAGHAVQLGDQNYLLPHKADLVGRSLSYADFEDQAIHAQWMLRKLSETGVARLIVALDACRDNPFAQSGDLGAGTGLAKMSAVSGGPDTLILFATQPGNTASDGRGSNSPFGEALASTIAVPGQSTQDMIAVIGEKVESATRGRQKPYFEGSLRHTFVRATDRPPSGRASNGLAGSILVEQTRVDGPESGVQLTNELLRTRTLSEIESQSAQGDGFASFAAGMAHWEGLGGASKDIKKAARFMQIANAQGSARAANALGLFYCCTEGFVRDIDISNNWFEIAANGGFVLAMRNLGINLTEGDAPRDFTRGLEWLEKAAERGSAPALANIGELHLRKDGPIYDPAKGFDLYKRSFDGGNAEAAWSLGNAYEWGFPMVGGVIDLDLAMEYFVDGGNAGCATCWARAAAMLNDAGKSDRYDPDAALALYQKGSEAGDLDARVEYGRLLKKGGGSIPPDPKGALEAFGSAAAAGSLEARGAAAIALARGEGTTRDIAKAAPELRALLENDRHPNLNVRHAIYEPNYWGFARDLLLGLEAGEIKEAYPGEQAALTARYGSPSGSMKRFTVPITCAETKSPFHVYIVDWNRPNDETLEGQISWLKQMRGCDFPDDVLDSFRKLKKIAREENVLFTELSVYALGEAPKKPLLPTDPAQQ